MTPAAAAASASALASARFVPRGHSESTCLPAASAALITVAWAGTFTLATTRSTSGWNASSSALVKK